MATAIPRLTVHHLHASSSERIPWLCEELNIPYTLKTYARDPQTKLASPEYKALHPAGSAPVIQDVLPSSSNNNTNTTITLGESGACVEYICHRHAPPSSPNSIFPSPSSPHYPTFLYFFHWSNGTFQSALIRALSLGVDLSNPSPDPTTTPRMALITAARLRKNLEMLDDRLADNDWLAGDVFTAADIMVVFSLTTFRYWYSYSLAPYSHIVRYLGRVGERDGYRRAMGKSDPGMESALGAEAPGALW